MKPMNFPARKERRRQAAKGDYDKAKIEQARTIRTKKTRGRK
jgi:hypothetical protein